MSLKKYLNLKNISNNSEHSKRGYIMRKMQKLLILIFIILINVMFNCNANAISNIKSFTDFSSYGKTIPNLNENIFELKKFNVTTNNKTFFAKLEKYFWRALNQSPMNATVEITPLNPRKVFDGLIFLDFRTEEGEYYDVLDDQYLPNKKIFCTVKLMHIFNLRGRILPSKINFNICRLAISTADLKKIENIKIVAQYLATQITTTVNNLSEISTEFHPKIKLIKNNQKILPLKKLSEYPIIVDFNVKLSKQFRIWHINNLKNFLQLIKIAKQQGYKKSYSEGQVVNIDNKYIEAEKVIFLNEDKSLTFNTVIIDEINREYAFFVTYDQTLATEKDFEKLIANYCKNNFINAVKYNFVLLNRENVNKYREIISIIDISKQPINHIRGYIFRSMSYLQRQQKLFNKLWQIYMKKVISFEDNNLIFPSVLKGFISDIRNYNKFITNNQLLLKLIDENSVLKNYKNYHNYGNKRQLIITVGIDDSLALIRLKYQNKEDYFITLNKIATANKKPLIIFKAIHKNQTETISSSKNELIKGIDLPVTIKIENIEDIDTKITLTLD